MAAKCAFWIWVFFLGPATTLPLTRVICRFFSFFATATGPRCYGEDFDTFWLAVDGEFLILFCLWRVAFSLCPPSVRLLTLAIPAVGLLASTITFFRIEIGTGKSDLSHLWIRAAFGDADAQIRMFRDAGVSGYNRLEDDEAKYWLRQAAAAGSVDAQVVLYHYLFGMDPTSRDLHPDISSLSEGMRFLNSAANKGNYLAEYDLGCLYEHGVGVPQSNFTAGYWFNLAIVNPSKHLRNPDAAKYNPYCKDASR